MNAAPRLASCYFATGAESGMWLRLARVLTLSARQHNPAWSIDVEAIAPASVGVACVAAYAANTQKLEWWARQVQTAADGDRLLLIDTDTMVVGALDALWDRPFDIALTARAPSSPFPLNGGVVAIQVNARSRAFVARWLAENRRLLEDPARHASWRRKFGGINQAALGVLLATDHGARVEMVPCQEWNCEDSTWSAFDEKTRIVHIKSALRRAIFHEGVIGQRHLAPLVRIWRHLEQAASATPAAWPAPPAPEPAAPRPVTKAALARPKMLRRRGRPKGPGTVIASVRIPTDVYDVYCRRSNATNESVHSLLQRAIVRQVQRPPA